MSGTQSNVNMADIIIYGQSLFTSMGTPLNPEGSHPGAVAIQGNTIIYVGDYEGALDFKQESTRIIDAGTNLIAPGLHDSHIHFFHCAMYASPYVTFCEGPSAVACIEALREIEDTRAKDDWLVCTGWRDSLWSDPTPPHRDLIDAVYPDRPVAMHSGDAHALWLNSFGMAKLGITQDTPDPAGGYYGRDGAGRLTGVVYEAAAMSLVPHVMAFTPEEISHAYKSFLHTLNTYGITSFCDMSLSPVPGGDFMRDDVYLTLDSQGDLSARATMYPTLLPDLSRPISMREKLSGNTKVRLGGTKQFFDGVFSRHTAWTKEPYTNAHFEGDCGRPTISPEQMEEMVEKAASEGLGTRIHAIGDKSVRTGIDIFTRTQSHYGKPQSGPNTLEHLELFGLQDIQDLSAAGVIASVQPLHAVLFPQGEIENLGEKRCENMWPFKTCLERGATLAFGTDAPTAELASNKVLYAAVTRQNPDTGLPVGGFQPHQKLTAEQALYAYTAGSAAAAGREKDLGKLAVGMLADIILIDRDITNIEDPQEILDFKIELTIMDGRIVYERQNA